MDRATLIPGVRAGSITAFRFAARGFDPAPVQVKLIGATGDWPVASVVMDWLEHGGPRPDCQSSDRWCTALEVSPDGRCWLHQRDGKWPVEDAFTAIGSGREYALAVMAVGMCAEKGVEVAARFDPGTGNGIDTLEISPAATAPVLVEVAPKTALAA